MPFNASGTYTLSDQIADATPASAVELEAILDDIQTALNVTFLRDGSAIATGQFLGIAGSTPQYSISGDTNTGFGSDTADEAYVKAGGVKTLAINATGGTVTGTLAITGGITGALTADSTGAFSGTVTVTGSSVGFVAFEGVSTEAAAAAGPIMSLYRNSATPAASDLLGEIIWYGKDSGGNKQAYGLQYFQVTDATDASEDADWFVQGIVGGALTTVLRSSAAAIQIPGTLAVTGAVTGAGITASAALSGATAAGAMLASSSDQVTGTATNKLVTPSVQHNHSSAAKTWCKVGVSGDVADSYNVTSVTDGGAGAVTFVIATDFASAAWAFSLTTQGVNMTVNSESQLAGTLVAKNKSGGGNTDPEFWHMAGHGAQ